MKGMDTVLISGCSSGLGLALAKQFSESGCRVFATARNPETIANLKSSNVDVLKLDVTDSSSIKNCVDSAINKAGKIDILVNNAGYAVMGPVSELNLEMLKTQYGTNLFGAIALSQAVVPHMIKSKSGKIVHISSIAGVLTMPFAGGYSSSKAALSSIADAMRVELKPFGISVMDVQPGAVKSSFGKTAKKSTDQYHKSETPYKSIAQFIDKRAEMSQEDPSSADDVAALIVKSATLKNPPARIRVGNSAMKAVFLKAVMPQKILDNTLAKMFGLDLLAK